MEQASCAGMDGELWFPFTTIAAERSRAVSICGGCPVRAECYRYAKTNGETFGIWGGVLFSAKRSVARGSQEEDDLREAVCRSLDSGWSLSKTASHLHIPFNMARRFAQERYGEIGDSDATVTKEVPPLSPTGQLFRRMKSLIIGEEK